LYIEPRALQQFRNFGEAGFGAWKRTRLEEWASSRTLKKDSGTQGHGLPSQTSRVFKDRHDDGKAMSDLLPPEA
jgi:hypothetical protein